MEEQSIMTHKPILMRGADIPPCKPQSDVPASAAICLLVLMALAVLGAWKLCELLAMVARYLNGGT